MRALLAIASLLLACSVAQAQYTIEYEGRTIRIDPDRGTVSIPGVYDNTGKKAKRPRSNQDGSQKQAPTPPQQTTVDRQPSSDSPAKPSIQDAQTPAPTAQPSSRANAAPAVTANPPAKDTAAPAPPAPIQLGTPPITPSTSPAPTVAAVPASPATAAPVARPQTPAPTTATAPPAPPPSPTPRARVPATSVATVAPAPPAPDPNSPVGIWLTEEKEGKVRIEPCGDNLCGYSIDLKSNANAEQVLINMKPAKDENKDQKWSGRIHDPNTGSDYDSTIALRSKDELRVQGCAFGGMFCGGQTWTRVN